MATPKRRYAFWRNLPHFQRAGRPLAITLATYRRWQMPPVARDCVFACCLHEHELARVLMHAFVVMPDHAHLLLTPLRGPANEVFSVSEIMAGIKGASA